jgi:hypothetical protein
MDLLRSMIANRQAMGAVHDPQPASTRGGKKPSKTEKAKEKSAGTKSMRHFIIEEKPGKRVVKEHFKAIIEEECASDSDED